MEGEGGIFFDKFHAGVGKVVIGGDEVKGKGKWENE